MEAGLSKVGHISENELTVPYRKLYSLANGSDLCLMWCGWLAAIVTGLALPSFVFIMGDIIDSFNPISMGDTLDAIRESSIIFFVIGVAIWVTSHIYYACLFIFAESVARKIRVHYLEAILQQDIAWFDMNNP